ncbi:hypothetical protein D7V97_21590 [Corallococcus sp. CA053C]|uniref:hypothetical protein n=1 Tax=Corallococcus sp. CA053C TaxID=2316732 RepID=UPI000EA2DA88|nr:hypothetical protein [Corallococcus sp. CA053C]RKH07173.1 hypothetical protein D7V97_21590 [Corallococcus sp. CA053C]
MKTGRGTHFGFTLLIGAMLLAAGCASTSVGKTWKSPALAQHPSVKKVVVVAMVPSEATRQQLEQELVAKLSEEGVQAVKSSDVLPAGAKPDKDTLRSAIEGQGYDSVLVARFAGIHEEVNPDPAMSYYDYYGAYGTDYSVTEEARMQVSLFDARGENGQLLWSTNTKTYESSDVHKEVPGLAEAIVKSMTKDHVVGSAS